MTDDSLIPSIRLDAARVGQRHSFDAWREAVRDVYDVEPISDAPGGEESVKGWLLDRLIFTEVAFSPQAFNHHFRHAANANYLSLQAYRKGACRGVVGDISFEIKPDELHIFDFSREFHSVADAAVVAGVVIPHAAIGYDPGLHPAHMKFTKDSPVGRFLLNAFVALEDQLSDVRQDEASMLAKGFCGLVRGILVCEEPERPTKRKFRAERRAEIRSYLERHLADSTLDVDHICRTFNVSRSSLYRDFAETGGVGHYIAHRRLDRVFHQLLAAPASRGRVQGIAAHWGFNDPGYFSRAFRRRFGISPSAALSMTHQASRSAPSRLPVRDAQILGDWIKAT